MGGDIDNPRVDGVRSKGRREVGNRVCPMISLLALMGITRVQKLTERGMNAVPTITR